MPRRPIGRQEALLLCGVDGEERHCPAGGHWDASRLPEGNKEASVPTGRPELNQLDRRLLPPPLGLLL
ncbi:hypothetical protein EYF80_064236 [Liparis tanakae]|uniref:Uncharacterized protein n=1 Tax=Liparis tanakae TaxID=230148 RepID=A0A4Z2EBH4_9TELE|nr:hypothetical protein EYF80_064236 [Liparis tanakae]